MGFGEVGFGEEGIGEVGFGEMGFGEVGFGEEGFGEVGIGEVGFGEVGGHLINANFRKLVETTHDASTLRGSDFTAGQPTIQQLDGIVFTNLCLIFFNSITFHAFYLKII